MIPKKENAHAHTHTCETHRHIQTHTCTHSKRQLSLHCYAFTCQSSHNHPYLPNVANNNLHHRLHHCLHSVCCVCIPHVQLLNFIEVLLYTAHTLPAAIYIDADAIVRYYYHLILLSLSLSLSPHIQICVLVCTEKVFRGLFHILLLCILSAVTFIH